MSTKAFLLSPIVVILASALCEGAVVFQDDFSGNGAALNGTAPDTRPGSEVWDSDSGLFDNGTVSAGSNTTASATLPFTPESGFLYTLELDVDVTSGDNDWVGLGFLSTGSDFFISSGISWMLARDTESNGMQTFLGTGTTGNEGHTQPAGELALKIVLDTQDSNWSVEWFANGSSLRETTFTTNPSIGRVGFGRNNTAAGSVDNFSLSASAVPEPSSFLCLGLILTATIGWRRFAGSALD